MMRVFLVCGLTLSLGACATAVRGTTEPVAFASEPPGAEVRTNTGYGCPQTPCSIVVPRKDAFVATFSLPGHADEQVMVNTTVSGGGGAALAGNVLAGGIVGVVVDASNGAQLDHVPNPVIAQLRPLKPVSPLIEGRRKPRRQAPAT